MERTSLGLLCLLLVLVTNTLATISNYRRCGDPACKEPVAEGVTLIGYPSNDKDILSFKTNAKVVIYSKDAGSRTDLWGVEINGKRGYAPKKYIRETRLLKSNLEYEIPTELFKNSEQLPSNLDAPNNEQPSKEGEAVPDATPSITIDNPDQIAITVEDVEYNHLNLAKEEHHPEEEVKDIGSQHHEEPNGEDSYGNSNEGASQDTVQANEQDDNEGDEEVLEKGKEEIIDDAETVEQDNLQETEEKAQVKEESTNIFDGLQATDSTAQEVTTQTPTSDIAADAELVNEAIISIASDIHSPKLESSVADYEVIDGTTIYFNEDIVAATPTLPDVEMTSIPQPSAVLETFSSNDPQSAGFQSSMSQVDVNTKFVEDTKGTIFSPGSSTSVLDDIQPTASVPITDSPTDATPSIEGPPEGVSPTAPNLRNLVLPPDMKSDTTGSNEIASLLEELSKDGGDRVSPMTTDVTETTGTVENLEEKTTETFTSDNIKPESSSDPYIEIAETSTDDDITEQESDSEEFGAETSTDDKISEQESDSEEFGDPKLETVIEVDGIEVDKPAENVGFFTSWFGSTETPENGDKSEEPSEVDKVDTDSAYNESLDVEPTNAAKEFRASNTDKLTDSSVVNASIDPVDASKNTETPYSIDDLDPLVVDSLLQTPPSVEGSPESAKMDSTDPLTQHPPPPPPLPDAAMTIDLADIGSSSEEDSSSVRGGSEGEPGPSTARPLYAEPTTATPTSQPSVDSDNRDSLADKDVDGHPQNDDDKISSAEGSMTEKFLKTSHNLLPEGLAFGLEAELAEPEMSSGALVFLGVVAATIITIYFVHLVMVKVSRESPMLEALNRMDREHRIMTAENTTLHEQLCLARAELEMVSSRVTESSGDITDLDSQLEAIKDDHTSEKTQLEEKIAQLEHELEETTTNGMEMHKMLSEMLSSQKDTTTFQASVDHLQGMLDGQREKVETLNSDLAMKTRLNEELHSELSSARERVTNLDTQVLQLTQSLKELSSAKEEMKERLCSESDAVRELNEVNQSLNQQARESSTSVTSLTTELATLQDTIATLRESLDTKDSELQVTKECLKQLRLTSDDDHAAPDEEKLSSLFDVIKVKAELQRVQSERNEIVEQLRDSETAQRNLDDAMTSIRSEVTQLRTTHDLAIQDKQEALSRLEVLTKYFEEKEAQLTRELESQEGLRVDAEGAAAAGVSRIHNYGLELSTYKAQAESLRKELQDQESSYKTQIATYEQKTHDNWLQARAAERRQEEQRQENSQLRTRLTLMQKEREDSHHTTLSKGHPKRVDANGSMSSPGSGGEGEGNHVDSPPVVPPHPSHHPLHGPPHMLPPMMFPPGGPRPLPGLPPGVPPPGLPHGVPPPHGLPPPPFMSNDGPPFMGPPLPPMPGDRRLPPAGGMSSPPFRRPGSPSYDHRNDRYSPSSEHSHFSDRHYSPPPLRHRPGSPDRRSDRTRSPDRRSDRMRSPDRRSNRRTPDRRLERRSPERHFSTRSPDGFSRYRSSPHYYDHSDFNSDEARIHPSHMKDKKTSTPLSSSDRWKNDA